MKPHGSFPGVRLLPITKSPIWSIRAFWRSTVLDKKGNAIGL
ncbi:hypothetical protein P4U99_25405 [Brevibacillus agri]|nr:MULTISPECIES: hypothetical protein [Brevibacillus]MDN4095097.1 hypothetical protein [Brevibacillus agri]MDR9505205.1 hypothetical protein [Brevibacillus agri]MED1646458.1 hypothetical protein [Brevibacillus agri]MED1652713.1 hypothetical protein [Brevibacillus agri]MED1690006.1 hypothetical protein [Brevibacillus agri]